MTRIEKRLREAERLRKLSDDLRTPEHWIREKPALCFAYLAEAIAVLLEELP